MILKKIRNKILEEEENYEEINNDSYKAKNKGEKGETNSFEIYEKTNNKIKENENENNSPNYFTENKKENVDKINNFIQLSKNMRKKLQK